MAEQPSNGLKETEQVEEGLKELSPGVSQFVESMGLLMEKYGLPRIGGRIMGLLLLEQRLLSLDDLAELLSVSRASVSTNVRLSETAGMVERVTRPGDRRDYYIGTKHMWLNTIVATQRDLGQMREAALKARPNLLPQEKLAQDRLDELIDFCEFFDERIEEMKKDWHNYRARRYEDGSDRG